MSADEERAMAFRAATCSTVLVFMRSNGELTGA